MSNEIVTMWGCKQVRQRLGCSQSTLKRWIKDPRIGFPQPMQVGKSGKLMWDPSAFNSYRFKPRP